MFFNEKLCCIVKTDYFCKQNMRKILYILIFLLTLSSVMSCGRSVDKRLVLADTLMWVNPDSSLTILQGINRDSLQGDENQAYYALLFTQARFRVDYYDYPSDSLINIALEHYRDNHNREHYTRALLYKGAYYEVHTNPTQAMRYYKMAEDNAESTDYRNLAQLNFRMGMLYYNNYASHDFDLDKFSKALYYYRILDNTQLQMVCHGYMGNLLRNKNIDSARYHLREAIKLATTQNDTIELTESTISLATTYIDDRSFLQAKNVLTGCLSNYPDYFDFNGYCALARAYCGLSMADSAKACLKKAIKNNGNQQQRAAELLVMSEIAEVEGHSDKSKQFYESYNLIADSLENNGNLNNIIDIEKLHQETNSTKQNERIKSSRVTAVSIATALVLLSIILIFIISIVYRKRIKRMQAQFKALNHDKNNRFESVLSTLKATKHDLELTSSKLTQVSVINESIMQLLKSHIKIMETLVKASYTEPVGTFNKFFKSTIDGYKMDKNVHDNILKYVSVNYPELMEAVSSNINIDDEEKRIINLVALGFDYIDVAVIMGKSPNSISTKFTRIARKLNYKNSLPKFVEEKKSAR